jgi:hypothetical protein
MWFGGGRGGEMGRMRKTILGVAAVGAVAGVAAARRRARHRDGVSAGSPDRWHSVTVHCEPEQLGPLPPPLDSLGFEVEVRIRPAPADRGTELAARIAPPAQAGRGTVGELRAALRKARALAEIGEIPLPDSPPTTADTLLSRPLAHATRHGREDGRL